MSSSSVALFFTAMLAIAAWSCAAKEAGEGVRPEFGWPWPTQRPGWPWPSSSPPPPPTDPWWCNRTYAGESLTISNDDDCPPPPAPTAPTTAASCPWPCFCPARPSSAVTTASATTDADACLAPLAALTSCAPFVTGGDDTAPALAGPCCAGLRALLNRTSVTAVAGGGDGDGDGLLLQCVCPLFLGDAHRILPKLVDVERLLYLPVACSTPLPPAFLFVCYTGRRTTAPVVSEQGD